jgi:Metallo-peptidase family M12/PKD domain
MKHLTGFVFLIILPFTQNFCQSDTTVQINSHITVTTAIKPFKKVNDNASLLPAIRSAFSNVETATLDVTYGNKEKLIGATDAVDLILPFAKTIGHTIKLIPSQVIANDFILKTTSNGEIKNYVPQGKYYHGSANDVNTATAFSIGKNGIAGIYANATGNNVLEKIPGTNQYVFYNDKSIINPAPVKCETKDDLADLSNVAKLPQKQSRTQSCKLVKMYIECTYVLYQRFNNNRDSLLDYVFTLFNTSNIIFKREGINLQIGEILIWDQPDIYGSSPSNPSSVFSSFTSHLRSDYINGDRLNANICYLLTSHFGFSGIANLGFNYCNTNNALPYGRVSSFGMGGTVATFPTFNTQVYLFAHETGHALGSPHTQYCGWPGGAIDNCAPTEDYCLPGPPPVEGGTIMSYCYNSVYGINFLLGFGPLPGALIRNSVEENNCLYDCADTVCGNLKVKNISTVITATTLKIKWRNDVNLYRIALKPSTVNFWTYYEVTNADSLQITKTACEELYQYTIEPFCTNGNKYGIKTDGFAGVRNAATAPLRFVLSTNRTACPGQAVLLGFRDSIYTYKWFNNGILLPEFTKNIIRPVLPGKYSAIANRAGCDYYSDTTTITLKEFTADFFISSVNKFAATFITSNNCGVKYDWDFGDGQTSNLLSPVHVYANYGLYKVVLKVYNTLDSVITITKTLTLQKEFTDSLNNYSQWGTPSSIKFNDFKCNAVAYYSKDSFLLNPTVYIGNGIKYSKSDKNIPVTGTLEFKVFPVNGLRKEYYSNSINVIADTGYIADQNGYLNRNLNDFHFAFTKWGGVELAIDSTFLGNITPGIIGPLQMNKWNTIGFSFGLKGIQLMVNGQLHASSNRALYDSALIYKLGNYNFGVNYQLDAATNLIIKRGFEGAIDKIRFSNDEQDYIFSSYAAWQGKDTAVINKEICYGYVFEGRAVTQSYIKTNTTADNCDSITLTNLKVYNAIAADYILNQPVDTGKGNILLAGISGGKLPYRYKWNSGDTTANLADAAAGIYTVTVTDALGCVKTYSFRLFQLNSNKDYIVVLPNPANENNTLTIRLGTTQPTQYTCTIYDAAGRNYGSQTIKTITGVQDAALKIRLRKGLYTAVFTSSTNKQVIKLLIE